VNRVTRGAASRRPSTARRRQELAASRRRRILDAIGAVVATDQPRPRAAMLAARRNTREFPRFRAPLRRGTKRANEAVMRAFVLCLLLSLASLPPSARADEPAMQPLATLVEIARAVAAEHAGRAGAPAEDFEIREPDPRVRLPACGSPLQGSVAPGTRSPTRLTVEVRCPVPAWRHYLAVRVRAIETVVVAARPLARTHVIGPADLALAPRDVGALPAGWFRSPDEAVGRVVTRPVGAGEALVPAVTRAEPVVRRGQEVTVMARAGGLLVRTKGVALGDAGVAERVRVRNPASERQFEAVVRSAGTVEVPLP
jgi:flagella basal body P-ring formation protein FlgA